MLEHSEQGSLIDLSKFLGGFCDEHAAIIAVRRVTDIILDRLADHGLAAVHVTRYHCGALPSITVYGLVDAGTNLSVLTTRDRTASALPS